MKAEKRKSKKSRALNFAAFAISFSAFIAVIWIVLPAPSYYVWLFSVLASEWSLGFSAIALLGMFCALLARFKNGGQLWFAAFLIGAAALAISFYPVFSAYQAARMLNVALSWGEYFSGFGTSNSVFNFSTRTFAEVDGQKLKVDIYQPPAGVEKNGAGIIVVHGGAWSGGERNDFPNWNAWLSENGFVVFDIDYRLTQPNWQTATGDVKCAAGWIRQNAAEFGISPDRIALLGRSAGAHLALLAAYSNGNSQLLPNCQNDNQTKIRAVVSFYAPTDLIWDFDHPANQAVIDGPGALDRFLGGNPHDSEEMKNRYLTASPTDYVSSATPPTLLIQGGHDQLVLPQNMNFLAAKLKENGVVNQEIFIPYAQHGFDYNFNGWGAQLVKPTILEFLRETTK